MQRWRVGADLPGGLDEAVARSREAFARLAGVPTGRVAIGASVSQLIANVAGGLPEGARVLVASGDFTSVRCRSFPFTDSGSSTTSC